MTEHAILVAMSNLDGLTDEDATWEQDPTVAEDAGTDLAGGEDVGEAEPVEEPEPEYDYLDVEDPTTKYVRVKVDGEEMSVPLAEALSGYSRTEDYTRKTQEVAAQRQEADEALRIARALQANPGLTMQVLANQAGVSVEEFLGMSTGQKQRAVEDASSDDDYYTDPFMDDDRDRKSSNEALSRVERLEQKLAQQEADQHLRSATNGLKQQFGASDEDVLEVVEQAIKMNVGLEFLPMIYQARRDTKTQAQIRAQAEARAQKEQQSQQRRQSAASASQLVGSGTGASSGGMQSGADPDKPMTVREAALAAFEQYEL